MRTTCICLSAFVFLLSVGASAQLTFPDGSEQSSSAEFRHVIKIDSVGDTGGDQTTNGTNLKTVMNAIAVDNATPTLVLLGSGTYNLGAQALTMKPEVTIRGLHKTTITGSAATTITSAVSCGFENVKIVNTSDGSTVVALSGTETYMKFVEVNHEGASANEVNIGIWVLGGAELEMVSSEVQFDGQSSNFGGFTGILIEGENDFGSTVHMRSCQIELEDPSEGMFLTGVMIGTGADTQLTRELTLLWSTIDVFSGDGRVNGVSVGSDGEFTSMSSAILTGSSSGDFDGTNATNNSGETNAIGTVVQGARVGDGTYHYAQSAQFGGSGLQPIVDTLTAHP